jgi:hypothetical protein
MFFVYILEIKLFISVKYSQYSTYVTFKIFAGNKELVLYFFLFYIFNEILT